MVNLYTERASSVDVVATPNCEIRFSSMGSLTDLSLRIASSEEHLFLDARFLVLPLVSWAGISVTAEVPHTHEHPSEVCVGSIASDRVADSSGLRKRPTPEPIKPIDAVAIITMMVVSFVRSDGGVVVKRPTPPVRQPGRT